MAKAKKLPSGSWRCQVFDYIEKVYDENNIPVIDQNTGKQKEKRIYKSFTCDDPSPKGKREAEFMAAEYAIKKKNKKHNSNRNLILRDAIKNYISNSENVLSPTTINGYNIILKNAFQNILDMKLSDITNDVLKQAVNTESARISTASNSKGKIISPKTVSNEYALLSAVISHYIPDVNTLVKLPQKVKKFHQLSSPDEIFNIVKGTDIELPVLLAMWLSFSISEIKGLTKSKSIQGDYLIINEVVVKVGKSEIRKKQGKQVVRNRKHRIPDYIKQLINKVDGDALVPMSGRTVYYRFTKLLKLNDLPHMTFHDLRHVNASVMALLKVPDKYAMERGGWKSDKVMKDTYMQTFSTERVIVDDTIDEYFEEKLFSEHEKDYEYKKFKSWLILFDKKDTATSKKEFKEFIYTMQHEMQHEKK